MKKVVSTRSLIAFILVVVLLSYVLPPYSTARASTEIEDIIVKMRDVSYLGISQQDASDEELAKFLEQEDNRTLITSVISYIALGRTAYGGGTPAEIDMLKEYLTTMGTKLSLGFLEIYSDYDGLIPIVGAIITIIKGYNVFITLSGLLKQVSMRQILIGYREERQTVPDPVAAFNNVKNDPLYEECWNMVQNLPGGIGEEHLQNYCEQAYLANKFASDKYQKDDVKDYVLEWISVYYPFASGDWVEATILSPNEVMISNKAQVYYPSFTTMHDVVLRLERWWLIPDVASNPVDTIEKGNTSVVNFKAVNGIDWIEFWVASFVSSTDREKFRLPFKQMSSRSVNGTFEFSNGTGNGTWELATGRELTGIATASCTISGDVNGGASTYVAKFNDADQKWYATSETSPVTISIGTESYTATLGGVLGNISNMKIGSPGYPNPSAVSFDFTAYFGLWTTDGSNIFVHAEGSGHGSATESWPAPGQWQMTSYSGYGSWKGSVSNLAIAPQANIIIPGISTITLSSTGEIVAQAVLSTISPGTALLAQYLFNPGGTPPKIPLGKYIEVNTNITSPQIIWPVDLRVYYSDEEVADAGIDERTLRMHRWDGSNWVLVPDSGVDTSANYVWAHLSSFSPYAPMGDPINTPIGSPVTVNLPGADVTFTSVTGEGAIVDTTEAAPCGSLPSGFVTRGSSHHITTTATYTGPVTVGIRYNDSGIPTEADMRLFHCDGSGWHDVTTSVDTVNNIIYGQDSTLSWWWIGDPPSGGAAGVPVFPNIYIGLAAALGAGILAYFARRRLIRQE